MASSKSSSKKRGRSDVFDAVEALETQDAQAERKRRAAMTESRDLKRSVAAQSQTAIYSSLVECRILLQRSILAQQQQQRATDSTDTDTPAIVVDQCNELLVKLLQARQKLSQSARVVDYEALVKDDLQLEEQLQAEYETYREEWKEVLDRRHKDVRLHSGILTNKTQFRVLDSTFWQQVESVVQHEQMRQQSDTATSFDDTKVYQQMLKDFVAVSSSQAAAVNSAQAAAQQRLLSKKSAANFKKVQVDRKASKGRKIRYTEIPKLANFTFPLSRPSSDNTTLDEDAWFRSLFGGARSVKS